MYKKKVEKELRENEKKYRTLIENTNDILVSTNVEGQIIYISSQIKRLGFSPEEVVSKNVMEFILPEDRERVLRDFKHTMMTGEEFPTEFRIQDKEGRIFWFEDIGRVQRDKTGKIIGLTGILRDITDHKQVEQELRESEERFRSLVEITSDWIWEVDQNGVYSYVSPKIKELLGYEPEEMIGRTPFDYMPSDEAKRIARIFEDIAKSQKPFATLEMVNLHKDGRHVVLETSGVPIFDVDGNLLGYRGIDRDITESRKAEEAIKESEEKYRLLIESSDAAITFFNKDGTYLFLNKIAAEWLNGKPEDYIGKTVHDTFPKDLADMFAERFNRIIKSGVGEIIEERIESLNRWIFSNLQPVRDSDRRVIGIQVVTHDITKKKKAEEEIKKLSSAVDQSIDGISIGDLEPKLTYVNDAFARMHGYSPKELIGKKVAILNNKEQMENFKKRIHIIKTKGLWEGETAHIRKDGTPFPTYISKTLLKDENGKPIGILAVCRDITERKRIEAEITSSHKRLRELSAHLLDLREYERKDIAHAVHDDLGQLLTVLKMDLSRLYEKLPPSQKPLQGMTKSLIEQAEKTMEVVQRISTELRPKLLDDVGLIPAIKWQVKEFQKRTGIRWKLNIIPQDIHLDHDLDTTIFRILQEGLTNVARHANATRVEVSLKEKNGKLMLKIRDNGKGITEKQISGPKSFGLMGIQERILSWEGNLEIKGIKDKGTTITIRIPLEKK